MKLSSVASCSGENDLTERPSTFLESVLGSVREGVLTGVLFVHLPIL
jgi:hypothetical protein